MEEALAAKCNKYSWEAGVCPRCFPQGLQVRRGAPGLALLHELPAMSRASTESAGWPRSDECLHANPSALSSPCAFLGFKMLPPSSKGWKPRGLLWFSVHLAQRLAAQISSGHDAR